MNPDWTLPHIKELEAKCSELEEKIVKLEKEKEQLTKDKEAENTQKDASESNSKLANETLERINAYIMILTTEVNRLKNEKAKYTEWILDLGGKKARDIEAAKKWGYDEAVRSLEPQRISQGNTIKELEGKVELARREGKEEGLRAGESERTRLQEEKEQFERRSAKVAELEKELLEQSRVNDALKERVNIQSNEIEKASKEKMQLKVQIHEKNSELVTREETIKKLEQARREEIESEARTLFDERRAKWEREEKPKELFDESSKSLTQVIETLDSGDQDSLPEELQPLIKNVKMIIGSRVKKEKNKEFDLRVEEGVQKGAKIMYQQKWPEWSKANVDPRVKELIGMINLNLLALFSGLKWTVQCNQCGTKQSLELTTERMSELLSGGVAQVQCVNPNCHPFLDLFRWYRYSFTVSLRELISRYLIQGKVQVD